MDDSQATEKTKSARRKEEGRVDRISDQTKGLIDDIKEWIDLRVQLIQIDIEERIETVANEVLSTVVVAILIFLIVIFLLVGAALGLGPVLGHPAWGFLAVAGFMGLVTLAIHFIRPRVIKAPNLRSRKALPAPREKELAGVLSAASKENTDDHVETE
jgi:Putative Actinobacterial Holin-X, holin superfamily III